MDVEIIEKKQNPLLNRQEIRFKILHPKEPTPNRDSTVGYAKVYPSKEEAMKNERDYHLVRNKLKEGKKKAVATPTLTTGPAPVPGAPKAPPAAEEAPKEEEPKEEAPPADEEKKEEKEG